MPSASASTNSPLQTLICPQTQESLAILGEAFQNAILFLYTLKLEPQPHVDFTWGFSNLNPAASSVST